MKNLIMNNYYQKEKINDIKIILEIICLKLGTNFSHFCLI